MSKILKSLILRSAFIQKQIDQEHAIKSNDWLKLIKLKKIRLKIKDRIRNIAMRSRKGKLFNSKSLLNT